MADLQKYISDALRTESSPEQAVVRDMHEFLAILQSCIAASNLLDYQKKNIYYKKPIDDNKHKIETEALSSAVNDLTRGAYLPLLATLPSHPIKTDPRLLHAIIGILTESGELINAIFNSIKNETSIDNVNIQEELGDLCWYIAIAVDTLGADWDNILETNIAKLKKRYPEKFTEESAINRDLEAERSILEGKE